MLSKVAWDNCAVGLIFSDFPDICPDLSPKVDTLDGNGVEVSKQMSESLLEIWKNLKLLTI